MSTGDTTRKLRLMKVDIRDFRGIDSLSLDFSDAGGQPLDLVVLAGGNGCGKTAVLEAILLLLTGTTELLPKDSAPLLEQIRFGVVKLRLGGNVRFEQANETMDLGVTFKWDSHLASMSKRNRTYVSLSDGSKKETLQGWSWVGHWEFPRLEYFSSRRDQAGLGTAPDMSGPHQPDETTRLRELKRRVISAHYRELRAARKAGPSSEAPIARLQRFWQRFDTEGRTIDVLPLDNNPGSGEEVILRDTRPIPDDITSLAMARQLAPTRADIPRMVPLDRLSSGQMELFALAGPLVFRDQPADIVLIDEPEHHLHVQWQRQLLPALRELSPGTQLIVATHSEEILDAALSYERFILVSDDDPRARLNGEEEGDTAERGEAHA